MIDCSSLRIGFLHRGLVLGGAEQVSYDTACFLSGWGISSTFFALEWVHSQWTLPPVQGARVSLLPQGRYLGKKQIEMLVSEIKVQGIRVLLVVTPLKCFPVELSRATDCKVVYWSHLQPMWEIIKKEACLDRLPLSRGLSGYLSRWQKSLKRLIWRSYRRSTFVRRIREQIEEADAYIVLCPQYKEELQILLGLPKEVLGKIYPVVNTFVSSGPPDFSEKEKLIVYVGRLSYPDKRVDRLLDIWSLVCRELPEWRLEIYGSGPEERRLLQHISDLGLQRVSMMGYVSDTRPVYARASVLCLTSNYEGCPLVMIEAQSCGVVPLAFDVAGGIRFLIGEQEQDSCLVPPFDLEAYASKLVSLCLDTSELRRLQGAMLERIPCYQDECNQEVWRRLLGLLCPDVVIPH